jgi:hypothetical protein
MQQAHEQTETTQEHEHPHSYEQYDATQYEQTPYAYPPPGYYPPMPLMPMYHPAPVEQLRQPKAKSNSTSDKSNDGKKARRRETNRIASRKHREKKRNEVHHLREHLQETQQLFEDTKAGFEVEIVTLRDSLRGLLHETRHIAQFVKEEVVASLPYYQQLTTQGLPPSYVAAEQRPAWYDVISD